MTESNLKKQTISSFFWKFGERFGSQLVSFGIQLVLARILAPEDFGCIAIVAVFVNLLNIFVQGGMNTAIIQTEHLQENDASSVFWASFALAVVLYSGLFFAAPAIALFYQNDQLANLLRVLGLLIFVNSFNAVQVALVSRGMRFRALFVSTSIASLVSGAMGVIFALSGGGVWSLVVQQCLFQLASCLVLYAQTRWLPRIVFDWKRIKFLFGFGWKILASNVCGTLYENSYDLIVGKAYGSAALGLFHQGKKIPNALVSAVNDAIRIVLLSSLSKRQSDPRLCKKITREAIKASSFVIAPIMFFVAADAECLVRIVLTDKWIDAVPFIQVFCIAYSFIPFHSCNLQAINAMGRSDIYLKLELFKDVAGIIFLLIAVIAFESVFAIALSFLGYYLFATFINAFPNRELLAYSYREQLIDVAPTYLLCILSAAISCVAGSYCGDTLVSALVAFVVFFAVYILCAALTNNSALQLVITSLRELKDSGRS